MTKRIALFNHKGGVSKTTTTFNLGWMLSQKGKKVVMVDADPQCNLTGVVLGYEGPSQLESFYTKEKGRNIKDALEPAFASKPELIKAVECVPVKGNDKLFLLPGHIRLAEYEVPLSVSQTLSDSFQPLQNLPGAISYLLNATAEKIEADYVIIDMSPSVSSINQNLLMTSDFFIIPTAPDYFSLMALDSLSNVLPKWSKWGLNAQNHPTLSSAAYPYPKVTPKFLGTIVQKYRPRANAPAAAFQAWIDKMNTHVVESLFPNLELANMTLDQKKYEGANLEGTYCLSTIADFNSLIAKSQQANVPVFSLTDQQINARGSVKESFVRSRNKFADLFDELANKIEYLTE